MLTTTAQPARNAMASRKVGFALAALPALACLVASPSALAEKNNKQAKPKPAAMPEVTVVEKRVTPATAPMDGFVADTSATASKTDTPLLEIPQSISVIGKDEIAVRAAQSVTQAVAYTPGLMAGMFGPSTRDDYFRLRGFDATQFLDGTRLMSAIVTYAQLRVDPYLLERIEVLRGPSSVMYGQNPPGGLVNMTSKRPTEQPFHEVQMLGGSFERIQGAFDFSGPVQGRDDLLYRIVGLGRGSNTQVDHVEDDRYLLAPSFTWRDDQTTFTFLSHYQRDLTGNAMQFLPYKGTVLPNPNGAIPTNRFLGEPGYDHFDREQFAVGYALEHRFSQAIVARQNLRYADIRSDLHGVTPFLALDTSAGGALIDNRLVERDVQRFHDLSAAFTLDNQLQAEFSTGPVHHTGLVGLDFRQFNSNRSSGVVWSAASLLDVFNPVYGLPFVDNLGDGAQFSQPNISRKDSQNLDQVGIYGQDQLRWERWIATVSLRQDWNSANTLKTDFQNEDTIGTNIVDHANPILTPTRQDDAAFTYRTALGYQFDRGVAPYYSYSESFDPAIGTTRDGQPFRPTTGQQHEVGIKYQPPGVNAFIGVSAYHLVQQNVLTPDLRDPLMLFQKQTGEVAAHGVDVEAKASLANGLNATAGYAYTVTEITRTEEALERGNWLLYTPQQQASLWLDYTIPGGRLAGLGAGAGTRYVGRNFGDLVNSQATPDYALADLAVHYDLGRLDGGLKGMRVGVNANNLLDETFVVACGEGSCFFGERRTVLANLRYNW